jgi:hypothetical protein
MAFAHHMSTDNLTAQHTTVTVRRAVAGTPNDDLLVIAVFLDVQAAYHGANVLVAPLFDKITAANSQGSSAMHENASGASANMGSVMTSPYQLLPPAPEHFRSVLYTYCNRAAAAAVVAVLYDAYWCADVRTFT